MRSKLHCLACTIRPALIALVSVLISTQVFAAPPLPKPGKKAPSAPTSTTATYENWVLRCVKADPNKKPENLPEKQCEVIQTIQVQGQKQPIAQLAIGYRPNEKSLTLTTLMPVNISLPGKIFIAGSISKDKKPTDIMDLTWNRCVQGGCFAAAKIDTKVLKVMRKSKDGTGLLGFTDANGRPISIPLSWNGLDSALNALEREKN